jgi:hypothetical protein
VNTSSRRAGLLVRSGGRVGVRMVDLLVAKYA